MKRLAKNRSGAAKLIALSAMAILGLSLSATGTNQKDSPSQWKMRYEAGAEDWKKGTKVTATPGTEEIFVAGKKEKIFSIPTGGIEQVVYDNRVHSRAVSWVKSGAWLAPIGPWTVWYGSVLRDSLISGAALGLGAAILSPYSRKEHYVHIFWTESDVPKVAVFKVGKKEYVPFMEKLQELTRKSWVDMPAERDKLKEELEKEKQNKVALQLQEEVVTATGKLKSGLYQVVLLRREGDRGELYFFKGKKVKTGKIKAVELVNVIKEPNNIENPEANYIKDKETLRIEAIRTATETYRIRRPSGSTENKK